MSNLCKWQVLNSNSYGALYKCINCGDFHEEYGDGDTIILPPLKKCVFANEQKKEDKK